MENNNQFKTEKNLPKDETLSRDEVVKRIMRGMEKVSEEKPSTSGKSVTEFCHELSLYNKNVKNVTNEVVAKAIEEDEEVNKACKETMSKENQDKLQRLLSDKCRGVDMDGDEAMYMSIQRSINSYNKN